MRLWKRVSDVVLRIDPFVCLERALALVTTLLKLVEWHKIVAERHPFFKERVGGWMAIVFISIPYSRSIYLWVCWSAVIMVYLSNHSL